MSDESQRWLPGRNKDSFVPGKLARVTETYPKAKVTYEGTIKRVNDQTVDLGDNSATVTAWLPGHGGDSVTIEAYVAPTPLPTEVGTIIEFYDIHMMIVRTATLGPDKNWWINGKPDWKLGDTSFNGEFRVIYDPLTP